MEFKTTKHILNEINYYTYRQQLEMKLLIEVEACLETPIGEYVIWNKIEELYCDFIMDFEHESLNRKDEKMEIPIFINTTEDPWHLHQYLLILIVQHQKRMSYIRKLFNDYEKEGDIQKKLQRFRKELSKRRI